MNIWWLLVPWGRPWEAPSSILPSAQGRKEAGSPQGRRSWSQGRGEEISVGLCRVGVGRVRPQHEENGDSTEAHGASSSHERLAQALLSALLSPRAGDRGAPAHF